MSMSILYLHFVDQSIFIFNKKTYSFKFTIRNIFWGVGIFSCSFVGVVAGVVVVGVVVVADAVEAASDDVVCSDFAVAGKILL